MTWRPAIRPALRPILRPVLSAIGNRRPTALTISQLLPSGAGRVAAIYSDPAKPSYDECIQKNMDAIAAGRPQDCVLFADAAGQAPVTYPIGAGQGKGLLLDRSAGLVRGPELVAATNLSTFTASHPEVSTTDTSFTNSSGGKGATKPITVGKWYEGEVSGSTTSTEFSVNTCDLATAPTSRTVIRLGFGRFVFFADMPFLYLRNNSAGTTSDVSISLKELPGHHQQQPTAAARGEFSRRVNRLDATEDIASGAWVKLSATVEQDGTLAPDGTHLAYKIVATAEDGSHGIYQLVNPLSGQPHDGTVYLKYGGHQLVDVLWNTGDTLATFDLVNGTTSSPNSFIEPVGSGWYRCGRRNLVNGASSVQGYAIRCSGTFVGDGTSGVYVWGADLRLTADAIPSIPAYQRVTSASDYDEVGFPTYWRAATDDWAKSHMNPNGATKAYVFWAGQQLSGAAAQPIFESSSDPAANSGVIGLYSYGPGFNVRSKGTLDSISGSGSSGPVGVRSACVGRGDIPSDVATLTLNGVQAVSSSADQGTGAYTEQDVFFGARGGTSLFANIREYAPPTILFLQPADSLSAIHLAKLQKGYAKAVGVTL